MINSRKITDLHPDVQVALALLIAKLKTLNITTQVIQTLRDAEYQNKLYKQGRSIKGPKVTNCDGYKNKSAHQSGRAIDIVPVEGKVILWERDDLFKTIADEAVAIGFKAGYYFRSLKDSPHIELPDAS